MVWNFSKLAFRHDRYFELSAQAQNRLICFILL